MGDVIPLQRRKRRRKQGEGHTLCANGRHRWLLEKGSSFDVSKGRLVTVYRCSRCGERRHEYQ